MSDDVTKFINKLSSKDKFIINELITRIKMLDLKNLDLKKLKGHDNFYRVRKGKKRIVFYWKDNVVEIIAVEKRDDLTYSSFY